MYNESQKKEYFAECKYENTTIETIVYLFNTAQLSEEHFGMDLCNFNRNQIITMLRGFNSRSRRRLQVACVYFSDYYNWCYSKNYATSNINEYASEMINNIIEDIIPFEDLKNRFLTLDDMKLTLGDILDVSNQFIAYAKWCGANDDELLNIKMEDFNENTNELALVTGRKITVDPLLYNLMWRTNDETFYYPDGIEKDNRFKKNMYRSSGYVIKQCTGGEEGKPTSNTALRQRFMLIKSQSGNDLFTASNIYKSGLFNYIKEQFKAQNISLKEAFTKKNYKKQYMYEQEIQRYIEDFGAKYTTRMLRKEISDYLDYLDS